MVHDRQIKYIHVLNSTAMSDLAKRVTLGFQLRTVKNKLLVALTRVLNIFLAVCMS